MADAEQVKSTASPQPPPDAVEAIPAEEKEQGEEVNDDLVDDGAMALDGAGDLPEVQSTSAPEITTAEAIPQPEEMEARIPAKKDATLREFLSKMDDYAPIVCRLYLDPTLRKTC